MGDLKNIMKPNAKIVLSGILEEKSRVVLEAIERENVSFEHLPSGIDTMGLVLDGEKLLSAGGRVLGVTAIAQNLETAIKNAYELTDKVGFENGFCRRDIGRKALNAEVK